jgi:hypothetical protein
MWFLSAGWCYALQAGSIANDGFAVIYILASIDLVLRARKENRPADYWLSLLAVALATGVKQTNAPLALLWVVAAAPGWRIVWRRPAVTVTVVLAGALVSILPVTLANLHYTGSAMPTEIAGLGNLRLNPFWGVVGNAVAIPVQNLLPPFYHLLPPFTSDWDSVAAAWRDSFMHTGFGAHFASFESFMKLSGGYEITEENATLGLGLCVLLLAGVAEAWRQRRAESSSVLNRQLWWLRVLPWGMLLIFMAKVGSYQNGRQLAPYYPFLLAVFLVRPGHSLVVRQRTWQRLGCAMMMLTALMIITSVDRPLFPAVPMCHWIYRKCPNLTALWMENNIYIGSNYRASESRRKLIRDMVPRDEQVLGFYAVAGGVEEFVAWLPLDGHRVERISPDDPPKSLAERGIKAVIVTDLALSDAGETATNFAGKFHARLTAKFSPDPRIDPAHETYTFYLFSVESPTQAMVKR